MNNFYILIYLTDALKNKCKGNSFQFSISPHKDVWEAYISYGDKSFRIIYSTNPEETALFFDTYRPPKKANTTHFFDILAEKTIENVTLAEHDRFVTFHFSGGHQLIFKIFGNNPNIFLTKDNQIQESFKSPDQWRGKKPPEPRTSSVSKTPDSDDSPKRVITKINPKFPRQIIPNVIDEFDLEKKSISEIEETANMLTNVMETNPEFRVLETGSICLLPQHILPAENLEVFDNVNDAVRFAYYKASRERRLSARRQSIEPKIERIIRKYESTIQQLQDAEKGLERADQYEKYGHILMAHAHKNTGHDDVIVLPDLYNQDEQIEISIKPKLSLAENAQHYYNKSAKSKRNVKESKRRLRETKEKLNQIKDLRDSLDKVDRLYEFQDWFKDHEDDLYEAGVLKAETTKKAPPYRVLEIDDYEIWVGRNAKSNDQLTTDAHKEDVWMHARGVSGSHVVIRMNNQKEMPPKRILLKTAAVAAWNSKARGSELAPVIITKRKYVTKPKGAPTGTVRVMREDVEMVQPQNFKS